MDKRRLNNLLINIGVGNEKAFEEFYNLTSKGIYAFVYPYLKDPYETEDALQDIYMLVKDKAHLYKKDTDARAWLFQLAKNHSLNLVYKKTRENQKAEELARGYSEPRQTKWDSTLFLVMQHTLEEDEYQIVIRYVLMNYKHKEIAVELNMPLGTVLSKYQTALLKLRKELEKKWKT